MRSMTGFAAVERSDDVAVRSWDIRAVNARGLDIRLRLPDGPEGLEKHTRTTLARHIGRGNVSLSLKVAPSDGASAIRVNPDALAAMLKAIADVTETAHARGVALAPTSAADVLALRGVLEVASETGAETVSLLTLQDDLEALLQAFNEMRITEGAAMRAVVSAQLDEIEAFHGAARALVNKRADHMASVFQAAMARVQGADVDPAKVSHDIAALAIKADVREELDRLSAHIAAARGLLEAEGPVGRKLDFLTQEFNREANTLCSKAQFAELTDIGLGLKTVIDQMREQVQNVE